MYIVDMDYTQQDFINLTEGIHARPKKTFQKYRPTREQRIVDCWFETEDVSIISKRFHLTSKEALEFLKKIGLRW